MDGIRIVEFPRCKMASSGYCKPGEAAFSEGGALNDFEAWWSVYDKGRADKWFMRDFIMYDREKGALVWYYALPDGAAVDCGWDVVDFEGGLYASGTAVLGDFECEQRVYGAIKKWVNDSPVFELDERPGHYDLSQGITSERAAAAMGYMQLEIYVPIKRRTGN